eukprot:GHVL01030756.1.p1 GENE.GHVL01030756.1~~GHVL01030756.1.p1  ORF type:complete len:189 (+),score=42.41 GHVL01030756.1:77-568(+)
MSTPPESRIRDFSKGPSVASPHQDRIHKLSQRLTGLQATLDGERVSRFESLGKKVKNVEERIESTQSAANQKFLSFKDQLQRYHKDLDEERRSREALAEQKGREVAALDTRLGAALEQEQQARREAEDKIFKLLDQKAQLIREELAREGSKIYVLRDPSLGGS